MSEHKCFGCGKGLGDMDPHIHVPLDEFAAREGMEPIGLDDLGLGALLTFAFCEACTDKTKKEGWTLEAHAITEAPDEH
jgi:hypothetical protein